MKTFNVNLDEMKYPLKEYKTFDSFFTRPLKDGARPIGQDFVSPADGKYKFLLIETHNLQSRKFWTHYGWND